MLALAGLGFFGQKLETTAVVNFRVRPNEANSRRFAGRSEIGIFDRIEHRRSES